MKKMITIRMVIDTDHVAKNDYWYEDQFLREEVKDSLREIELSSVNRPRNCGGWSPSGATEYKVCVRNQV